MIKFLLILGLLLLPHTLKADSSISTCSYGCQCYTEGSDPVFTGYMCQFQDIPWTDDKLDHIQQPPNIIPGQVMSLLQASAHVLRAMDKHKLYLRAKAVLSAYNIARRGSDLPSFLSEQNYVSAMKILEDKSWKYKKYSTTKPVTFYHGFLDAVMTMDHDDRNSIRLTSKSEDKHISMACEWVDRRGAIGTEVLSGKSVSISLSKDPDDGSKRRYQCAVALTGRGAPPPCFSDCKVVNTCSFSCLYQTGKIAWRTGQSGNDDAWDRDNENFVKEDSESSVSLRFARFAYDTTRSVIDVVRGMSALRIPEQNETVREFVEIDGVQIPLTHTLAPLDAFLNNPFPQM